MRKKSFSISEEQGEYLLSTANYVKSRGGTLSESGIVRVALELLMEFPIDIRAAKDEDALRRRGLILMELAKDAFKTLKIQLAELDYQERIKDKTPDGVYMVNEKGNFTLINRVAQKRIGYTREDLIGEHFSKIVAPEYRDMLNEYLEGRMSGQEDPGKYRVEIITKNKERFPVELNITPMTDEEGAMVAVFGIAKEISSNQV
jgi:PAS domain S-box-containing protein